MWLCERVYFVHQSPVSVVQEQHRDWKVRFESIVGSDQVSSNAVTIRTITSRIRRNAHCAHKRCRVPVSMWLFSLFLSFSRLLISIHWDESETISIGLIPFKRSSLPSVGFIPWFHICMVFVWRMVGLIGWSEWKHPITLHTIHDWIRFDSIGFGKSQTKTKRRLTEKTQKAKREDHQQEALEGSCLKGKCCFYAVWYFGELIMHFRQRREGLMR